MAIIKKTRDNKRLALVRCGEKRALVQCWWDHKLVHPLWKAIWRFLQKLKNKTTIRYSDPTSMYAFKEMKTGY